MTLPKPLLAHRRIYLDSMVYIYELAQREPYYSLTHHLFQSIETGHHTAVSSCLVFTEMMVNVFRKEQEMVAEDMKMLFLSYPHLQIVNVNPSISILAARLRAHYHLKTPDALHLATAFVHGIKTFVTNDQELKKVKGMNVVVLDELMN
jgi:predicted nucleic acid-binding protein